MIVRSEALEGFNAIVPFLATIPVCLFYKNNLCFKHCLAHSKKQSLTLSPVFELTSKYGILYSFKYFFSATLCYLNGASPESEPIDSSRFSFLMLCAVFRVHSFAFSVVYFLLASTWSLFVPIKINGKVNASVGWLYCRKFSFHSSIASKLSGLFKSKTSTQQLASL